jgi:hypothetical protein
MRCMYAVMFGLIVIISTRHQAQGQTATEGPKIIQALPTPSGTMPIGRRRYEWLDPSRKSSTGGSRVVVVSIFYPSADRASSFGEYVEGAEKLPSNEKTKFLRDSFGPVWQFIATGKVLSHAQDNIPILKTARKLPILLFSPGLGIVSAAYSIQLEDLASHGYVVVAVDHPYDSPLLTLTDGTLIPFDQETWNERQPPGPPTLAGMKFAVERQEDWVRDSTFVLREMQSRSSDPFLQALDFGRIGAFGHSFGGVVAIKLCQRESSVQACVNEDGEMSGKTLTPNESAPADRPNGLCQDPTIDFYACGARYEGKPFLHAVAQGKTGRCGWISARQDLSQLFD